MGYSFGIFLCENHINLARALSQTVDVRLTFVLLEFIFKKLEPINPPNGVGSAMARLLASRPKAQHRAE